MARSLLVLALMLLTIFLPQTAAQETVDLAGDCRAFLIKRGSDPTDIEVTVDPDHCIRDWPGQVLSESPYCIHGSEPGCRGLEDLDQQIFDAAWTILDQYGCILGTEPWC